MIEYFLASVITLICSLVLLYMVVTGFYSIKNYFKNQILVVYSAFICTLSILFFFLLPTILRIFSEWRFVVKDGISPFEVASVYLIETASFIIWFMAIVFVVTFCRKGKILLRPFSIFQIKKKLKSNGIKYLQYINSNSIEKKIFLNFSLWISFFLFIISIQSILSITQTLFYPIDWFILPAIRKSGVVFVMYAILLGRKEVGTLRYLLFFIFAILIFSIELTTGSRGTIVVPAIYILFFMLFIRKKLIFIVVLVIGAFFLVFFNNELHMMRAYYHGKKGVMPNERLQAILSAKGINSDKKPFIEDLEWRFGANSRASVGFIRMVNRGFYAKHMPLKNSLYSFLPRSIFSEKPVSGSIDGTIHGAGMYLMNKEITGKWWIMSSFFTGLHAYWEGGFTAVILNSLIAGIYIAILLMILDKFIIGSLPILMVAFDTWWQMPKLWLSEIVIQIVTYMAPLILIWFLYYQTHRIIGETLRKIFHTATIKIKDL